MRQFRCEQQASAGLHTHHELDQTSPVAEVDAEINDRRIAVRFEPCVEPDKSRRSVGGHWASTQPIERKRIDPLVCRHEKNLTHHLQNVLFWMSSYSRPTPAEVDDPTPKAPHCPPPAAMMLLLRCRPHVPSSHLGLCRIEGECGIEDDGPSEGGGVSRPLLPPNDPPKLSCARLERDEVDLCFWCVGLRARRGECEGGGGDVGRFDAAEYEDGDGGG